MSADDLLVESPLDSATPVAGQLVQIKPLNKSQWLPSRFNARATRKDGVVILWNTYTGSVNVFQSKYKEALDALLKNKSGFSGELKGLAKYLYERGYIVAQGTNEYRRLQLLFGQQHYSTDRLELILLASEDCNFRCVYCYEDFARGTMLPSVREGVKNLVYKKIKDGLRTLGISWFGGEPLYGFKAIEDLAPFFTEVARQHSIDYSSHMTTNGYLLTPDVARRLFEWRIFDYQITIDGTAEQHDHKRMTREGGKTFQVILSNLRELQKIKENFSITVRVNYDRENYSHLGDLLNVLQSDFSRDERYKVSFHAIGKWGGPNDASLSVCGVDETRRVGSQLKSSALDKGLNINTLKQTSRPGSQVCYAARPFNFIIGADGKVMKCTIALDKEDYNVVGSLATDGELHLDSDKFARWVEPAFESDKICQSCYLVPTCQGLHCPLIRFETNKQPCPSTKSNLRDELLTTLEASNNQRTTQQPEAG
jgi:uncharacterized protein